MSGTRSIALAWFTAIALAAGIIGLALAGSIEQSEAQSAQRQPRAYLPVLSCDSCVQAQPSPTKTATATPTSTSTPVGTQCLVTNVVDGDTIDVSGCADAGRIRLILIDTPEVYGGAECFGKEASAYTKGRLLGKTVSLEKDVSNTDRYGRLLRYVWLGSELFNEQIVRDGYAALATFPPDVKYMERIRAAQTEARDADRGLWGACGGVDTPASPTPTSTTTATATHTKTATATPTSGGGFTLPACYRAGQNNCNCSDFDSHDHAQWFHDTYDPTDVNKLDSDQDGLVCEGL